MALMASSLLHSKQDKADEFNVSLVCVCLALMADAGGHKDKEPGQDKTDGCPDKASEISGRLGTSTARHCVFWFPSLILYCKLLSSQNQDTIFNLASKHLNAR